jgi:hypothetical protein
VQFIDTLGMSRLEFKEPEIGSFNDGLAKFYSEGYYGYINLEGILVVEPLFSNAYSFNGGFAKTELNGFYGFINTQGQTTIPHKYELASDFNNGLSLVEKRGKKYYVDTNGFEYFEK